MIPLHYNRSLGFWANGYSSRDSGWSPLTAAAVHLAEIYLPNVRHREFQLISLPHFVESLRGRSASTQIETTGRTILSQTHLQLWWSLPLRALDSVLDPATARPLAPLGMS